MYAVQQVYSVHCLLYTHTSVYYPREVPTQQTLYETLSSDVSCVLATHSYVQKQVASISMLHDPAQTCPVSMSRLSHMI